MDNCVFCNRKLDKGEIIFETPDFVVEIGIGIAAPGHVMLISKEHYPCFADMPAGLRPAFIYLKNKIIEKAGKAFGDLFLVEYGPVVQTVGHAHLHFIPKQREATDYYPAYRIGDIFEEMDFPPGLIAREATWESAVEWRQKYGRYVYLWDGRARIYSEASPDLRLKELGYRKFFKNKLKINDIPERWQDITEKDRQTDAVKKEITKSRLKL